MIKTIYQYREFILGNIKREFQSKYSNSLLGAVWSVLNPLSMIVVYTVIFSQIMKAKLPGVNSQYAYSIYLCSGVIIWGLFADIIIRGQNMFIENANLIKKLSFPKICLPITAVGSALLNFLIIFILFVAFLVLSVSFPGLVFLGIIPVLIVMIMLAQGLGTILGVFNVFYRDVGQFFGIILQFWFWLTPIIYPLSVIPENMRWLMDYNPMLGIIESSQRVFVNGIWPDWSSLIYPLVLAVILNLLGYRLLKRSVSEMVDEL